MRERDHSFLSDVLIILWRDHLTCCCVLSHRIVSPLYHAVLYLFHLGAKVGLACITRQCVVEVFVCILVQVVCLVDVVFISHLPWHDLQFAPVGPLADRAEEVCVRE